MRPSQRRRLIRRSLVGGVGAVVVAAAIAAPVTLSGGHKGYEGDPLTPPLPRPTQTLTDTSGKPFDFAARTKGKATLLYFGYTHCPDLCPTTMADVHQALEHSSAAVRADTQVVFVTVDPDHDSLSDMRTWLDRYDPSFIGLKASSYPALLAFSNVVEGGVSVTPPKTLANGSVDVTHTSTLIGLTPDGGAPVFWIPAVQGPTLQNQLEHDLPLLDKGLDG